MTAVANSHLLAWMVDLSQQRTARQLSLENNLRQKANLEMHLHDLRNQLATNDLLLVRLNTRLQKAHPVNISLMVKDQNSVQHLQQFQQQLREDINKTMLTLARIDVAIQQLQQQLQLPAVQALGTEHVSLTRTRDGY